MPTIKNSKGNIFGKDVEKKEISVVTMESSMEVQIKKKKLKQQYSPPIPPQPIQLKELKSRPQRNIYTLIFISLNKETT